MCDQITRPKESERKILAILFSDIKGYSKMMGEDEPLALRLLKEHNAMVIPRIKYCGGTVLKTIGDAVLASFSSAVEAVTAAIQVQDQLRQRNASCDNKEQIWVRIGIHVGDVVLINNDVFGDGVNVASRIESLADAGGICVSKTVHDMIYANPEFSLVSQGLQDLKNIKLPVEVFKVSRPGEDPVGPEGIAPSPPDTSTPTDPRREEELPTPTPSKVGLIQTDSPPAHQDSARALQGSSFQFPSRFSQAELKVLQDNRKPIIKEVLLSALTLGIYGVYWEFQQHKAMNILRRDHKIDS